MSSDAATSERCDWCDRPGSAQYEGNGARFWVCADHIDKAETDYYKRATETQAQYVERLEDMEPS